MTLLYVVLSMLAAGTIVTLIMSLLLLSKSADKANAIISKTKMILDETNEELTDTQCVEKEEIIHAVTSPDGR